MLNSRLPPTVLEDWSSITPPGHHPTARSARSPIIIYLFPFPPDLIERVSSHLEEEDEEEKGRRRCLPLVTFIC